MSQWWDKCEEENSNSFLLLLKVVDWSCFSAVKANVTLLIFFLFECKTFDCCQPGELDPKPQRSAVLLAWKPQSKALLFQGATLWYGETLSQDTKWSVPAWTSVHWRTETKYNTSCVGHRPSVACWRRLYRGLAPSKDLSTSALSPLTWAEDRCEHLGGHIPKLKEPC